MVPESQRVPAVEDPTASIDINIPADDEFEDDREEQNQSPIAMMPRQFEQHIS